MSGETKLTGPDLTQGFEAHDVPEGGVLVGHAHGESVIVARARGEVFAVGGACTHYGAPLADGMIVGDTIRCPWHHACFSLSTGEPLRGPALNHIPCFDVGPGPGGKLVVLERRGELTARRAPAGPSSVVIVGAGAAGNACAETLRREGYAGPLTILGAEDTGPVDRPNLSKDYLAGNAPEEWIPLRPPEFYKEKEIDLRTGARVASLDLAGRRVALDGGDAVPFGALVLATGATPNRLDLPGADPERTFVLRTLADTRALLARAKDAKRAVVIGASFLGLEVAASLRARGLEVDVVGPETVPLARILGDGLGGLVRSVHEAHGTRFHLGGKPKQVRDGAVVLEGGAALPADLVVVAVGVKPETSLAEKAGLKVDRGVVVDAELRAGPGVWAAGDVARWPDPRSAGTLRVEHWVVAGRMGQLVARNVLGAGVRCDLVPFFWSAHHDLTINYVGHAERWDRIDVDGDLDARDAAVAYRAGGKTLAVATVNRDKVALAVEAALEKGDEKALQAIVPARG